MRIVSLNFLKYKNFKNFTIEDIYRILVTFYMLKKQKPANKRYCWCQWTFTFLFEKIFLLLK